MTLNTPSMQMREPSVLLNFWNRCGIWKHALAYLFLMLPFSLLRHIRIHGDEKVYVGQALEMIRAGHFWQQLQFGDINYIKGPSHYLLLILGHHLFGLSMLSTVYMNLLLGALAVVALRAAAEHLLPKESELKALPAWLFAGSGAYVLFSFSSQMDSELTSLYAISLSLAVLARSTGKNLYFLLLWLCVGFAGTLKSPLHSCLLGVSVLAYFAICRGLITQLFSSPTRIGFLLAGVVLGGSGYLIPFLLDRENWLGTYIFREQIDRPRHSDSAIQFLLNNFLFHLFPWSLLVVHCVAIAVKRIRAREFKWDELTKVSLAFMLPTFAFFFGLGYLAPWYGLPMLAPLALLIVGQLQTRPAPFKDLANSLIPWSALMLILALLFHMLFHGGTTWWTAGTSLLICVLFLLSFLVLEAVIVGRKVTQHVAVFGAMALFWTGSLGLTSTLGEAELSDLHSLTSKHDAPLNYNNMKKENYSEWGYMAYMSGKPSFYSTSYEELLQAGQRGEWLVFSNAEELNRFWDWLKTNNPDAVNVLQPDVNVWRRWPRNVNQMREIWNSRTSTENFWDRTTRHYLLVRFQNLKAQVSLE